MFSSFTIVHCTQHIISLWRIKTRNYLEVHLPPSNVLYSYLCMFYITQYLLLTISGINVYSTHINFIVFILLLKKFKSIVRPLGTSVRTNVSYVLRVKIQYCVWKLICDYQPIELYSMLFQCCELIGFYLHNTCSYSK